MDTKQLTRVMSACQGKFNAFFVGFFLEKKIYLIEDRHPFMLDQHHKNKKLLSCRRFS